MSRTRAVDRLREDVRRRVGDRVTGLAGLDGLAELEATVDSLEVAVAENRALEVPLSAHVDALERDVAEVLTRRGGTGMGA